MQFAVSLVSVAATALAAPLPSSVTERDEPALAYLKTQLINGPTRFDGLFLESYHTGAGYSDAVFASTRDHAVKGFLNGTSWQFDLGTDFPWGLNLYGDTNYAAWDPVTIDAGTSKNPGFYFNETEAPGLLWGRQYNKTSDIAHSEFKNWLACDWQHGLPQLFWHYSYYNYSIPLSCAEVWLVPDTCA